MTQTGEGGKAGRAEQRVGLLDRCELTSWSVAGVMKVAVMTPLINISREQ
jgi:hypothetical protein